MDQCLARFLRYPIKELPNVSLAFSVMHSAFSRKDEISNDEVDDNLFKISYSIKIEKRKCFSNDSSCIIRVKSKTIFFLPETIARECRIKSMLKEKRITIFQKP